MYLATLGPRFLPLSTYFIAILEGVGGGGTHKKARAKNTGKKQSNKPYRLQRRLRLIVLKNS
jgi:hypothetical protein